MTDRLLDVRDTPLSVDECLDAVRRPSAGGIAIFVGVVRDRAQGGERRTLGDEVAGGHVHLEPAPGRK